MPRIVENEENEVRASIISRDEAIVEIKAHRGRKKGQLSNPYNLYIKEHYLNLTDNNSIEFIFIDADKAKKRCNAINSFLYQEYPELKAVASDRKVIVMRKKILVDEGLLKLKLQQMQKLQELNERFKSREPDAEVE